MTTRAEQLKSMKADLTAQVLLYSTAEGGRSGPVLPGYGCPCVASKSEPLEDFSGWMLLGDEAPYPGDQRDLGFVFLTPEGASAMRAAGTFYLWEGRSVGEAKVIS
jgi:hypothetical protein